MAPSASPPPSNQWQKIGWGKFNNSRQQNYKANYSTTECTKAQKSDKVFWTGEHMEDLTRVHSVIKNVSHTHLGNQDILFRKRVRSPYSIAFSKRNAR